MFTRFKITASFVELKGMKVEGIFTQGSGFPKKTPPVGRVFGSCTRPLWVGSSRPGLFFCIIENSIENWSFVSDFLKHCDANQACSCQDYGGLNNKIIK